MSTKTANGTTTDLKVATPELEMFPWGTRFGQLVEDIWRASWPHGLTLGAELEETDKGFLIELDLPGVRREDVTIDVAERRVSITGSRKEREHKGVLRRSTRSAGEFTYEFLLPADVDQKGSTATLADGVLKVTLHKTTPAATTHRVPVS